LKKNKTSHNSKMACFIKEQNVIEGQNPVKVYITRRGKTVSNYQSNVPIRHSVFNSLSPALQLSILRRKAQKKELKEKKERFGRLANIDNFGMADFLTEPESKAVSGISPEMTEKVKKLPQLLPTLPEDPKLRQRIVSEMIAYDYDRSGSLYYADNMIAHIQRLITPRSPLNTYYYKVIDYINKIKRDRPFSSITGSQWNRITQWNRIGREL
jgi:hypothetical protein